MQTPIEVTAQPGAALANAKLCRSAGGLDLDSMRIQTCPTGTISRKGRGGILKVDGGVKFKFRGC